MRIKKVFLCTIVLAFFFSSCGLGNHSSLSFNKRKYTLGHFSDPIAKAKPVVPAKTFTKQESEASIATSPVIPPVLGTKTIRQPGSGSGILNHINSFVLQASSHTVLNKFFPDNAKLANPDNIAGIPDHSAANPDARTTNYGEAGLLLTILGILGFLIGIFLVFIAILGADSSGSQQSSSNNSSSNSDVLVGIIGGILAIGGPIAFIIGIVFNIMGANKNDKHQGAAIAGLVLDGLLAIICIGAIIALI